MLKALMVRVKIAGGDGTLKAELKNLMVKLSTVSKVMSFFNFWRLTSQLVVLRTKRLIHMQTLGTRLRDISERTWQSNR